MHIIYPSNCFKSCILAVITFFCLGLLSTSATPIKTSNTTVDLVADVTSIKPGQSFNLALTFELEPHWHVYWQNPGASGLPVEINWTLPEGIEAGEIIWPAPERIELGGLINYVYEDQVSFVIPITTAADLKTGEILKIKANVFWLICKELCLPDDATFEIELPTSNVASTRINSALFESAQKSWPETTSPWTTYAEIEANNLVIHLEGRSPFPQLTDLYFYALTEKIVDPNVPQKLESTGQKSAKLIIPLTETFDRDTVDSVNGVLQANDISWSITAPWMTEITTTETGNKGFEAYFLELGLPGWLLLAFLGGMILNVMPCVLPVLSLKVFSLLSHTGDSRAKSLKHGLAYTIGVVASFLLLAGLLISLRALGERIGWGFQLQSPAFIVVLFLLFFLFALNLMSVFEIGTSLVGADMEASKRTDLFGSFGMGVLAAVVGAPCVGPLLASVGGIAVQAAPATGLLIFGTMGLGLAAPFLFLAVFPKLTSYLPKPGAWMETFKHMMGFMLFAAAIFLIAVAGASGGVNAILPLLLCALTGSIAAWIYGRWATPVKKKQTRLIAQILSGLILISTLYSGVQAVRTAYEDEAIRQSSNNNNSTSWNKWSDAQVDAELAKGHPVFVDFTASWCLICQVNKKVALRTEKVEKLFADNGIVTMEADWTRYDSTITEALERFGRSGVPLYLLYNTSGEVTVLPQSLTPGIVEDAIAKITE